MSKQFILTGYRPLRVEEKELMERAIIWLRKRRLEIDEITFLTIASINRNEKTVDVRREGKICVIWHHINYEGSPFDLYLTEVFPYLNSRKFIFVRWAYIGRQPNFCTHILFEDVQKICLNRERHLLTLALKFDTLEVAKVNLHIRN